MPVVFPISENFIIEMQMMNNQKLFMYNEMIIKSIDDLFKRYPWKTALKLVPLAKCYRFAENEARKFLRHNVILEVIPDKPKFMNIYSKHSGGYQMNTFINNK